MALQVSDRVRRTKEYRSRVFLPKSWGSWYCWVMSGLIKTFLTGAARMHVQRGRKIPFSLSTIAFLAWRKHCVPIPLEGKRIYIGYKERAEPGSGWCSVLSLVPLGWQGVYLLSSLVVRWGVPPNPNVSIGLRLPIWEFPCLVYREGSGLQAEQWSGWHSRALCSPNSIMPGCINLVHFLKKV